MEIKQVVGAVRVNDPYKDTNRSYECAAWWEEREAIPGVYPLTVGYQNPLYPKTSEYYLRAKVDAVVTDDYFPGLFGGVSISKEPYKPKHIGEKREIGYGISLIDAINKTANIPRESTFDIFFSAEHWEFVLEDAKARLEENYMSMPKWWEEYQVGDDEHDSKVGMVGHFAKNIARFSKYIERINFLLRFRGTNQTLYTKNTEWAQEVLRKKDS